MVTALSCSFVVCCILSNALVMIYFGGGFEGTNAGDQGDAAERGAAPRMVPASVVPSSASCALAKDAEKAPVAPPVTRIRTRPQVTA